MAKGIYMTGIGFNKVIRNFQKLPGNILQETNRIFEVARDEIHREAVIKAPAEEGGLRLSITKGKEGGNYTVTVQKRYGAYLEFGTKKKFKATPGFESYARRFHGPTGIKGNPIDALQGWVKRKGLAGTYSRKTRKRTGKVADRAKQDRQLAFIIWRKIRVEGIKPQPYLLPAFVRVRRRVVPEVVNAIKKGMKK